jgi:hypothetical protein
MKLRDLAHARAGDKGDTSNIALIVRDMADFDRVAGHVTVERVALHFGTMVSGPILRHALPHLGALNFVLHGALGGGVTRSLSLDAHGKSLSSSLLEMELP